MMIELTEEHINKGEVESGHYCPIALAIKERIPDERVIVGYITSTVGDKSYALDKTASQFIQNFDSGRTVNPIVFSMTEY